MNAPEPVGIVTGGSRGAGRELALELARRRFAVVVVFLGDRRAAEDVVETILAGDGTAFAIRADVTDALDVERIFDETLALFDAVDVVIHAAPCPGRVLALEAGRRRGRVGELVDAAGAPALLDRRGRTPGR